MFYLPEPKVIGGGKDGDGGLREKLADHSETCNSHGERGVAPLSHWHPGNPGEREANQKQEAWGFWGHFWLSMFRLESDILDSIKECLA